MTTPHFSTAAELPAGEGEVFHVLRAPAKSLDFHQIVEHPIHPIKAMFQKQFTPSEKASVARAGMNLLEDCIKDCKVREYPGQRFDLQQDPFVYH